MPEFENLTKTITAEQRQEFHDQLTAAYKASQGYSNDEEIEALWDLAHLACAAFDVYRDDEEDDDG
jgi:RNAse (barnase) inhibitor barstar